MMQRYRRAARASSLVLVAALGLVGCGGDGGSPVDSMMHVSLLPTYAQVEGLTGGSIASGRYYVVGEYAVMLNDRPFPICWLLSHLTSQAMILGPAFPVPDNVEPYDASRNLGAAAQYLLTDEDGFSGLLLISVAQGTKFIPNDWSGSDLYGKVFDYMEVAASYPQLDPLAFEWASASLREAQTMAEQLLTTHRPEYDDAPCARDNIASVMIDGLPVGVVGYRDRQIDLEQSTLSLPPETPFVDGITVRYGQTLFATVGDEWSVMVSLYSGDVIKNLNNDPTVAVDALFAVDLIPVLEETVRLVQENGTDVLTARRAPSWADAIKYLQRGWHDGENEEIPAYVQRGG